MPTINSDIAILEFRPGPGGEESTLWMDDLMRMYGRYAAKVGWKTTQIDTNIIKISGVGAFDQLNETGTHRVQRIPITENMAGSTLLPPPLLFFPKSPPLMSNLTPTILKSPLAALGKWWSKR